MARRSGICSAVSADIGCINLSPPTQLLRRVDGSPAPSEANCLSSGPVWRCIRKLGRRDFQRGSSPPSFVETSPGLPSLIVLQRVVVYSSPMMVTVTTRIERGQRDRLKRKAQAVGKTESQFVREVLDRELSAGPLA